MHFDTESAVFTVFLVWFFSSLARCWISFLLCSLSLARLRSIVLLLLQFLLSSGFFENPFFLHDIPVHHMYLPVAAEHRGRVYNSVQLAHLTRTILKPIFSSWIHIFLSWISRYLFYFGNLFSDSSFFFLLLLNFLFFYLFCCARFARGQQSGDTIFFCSMFLLLFPPYKQLNRNVYF